MQLDEEEEPCLVIPTNAEKTWTYDEYYIGERDEENRKSRRGEYHWSGAKSLEWYNGRLFRDTMHGLGVYRWRYLGYKGTFFTYEGHFYCNSMHGYGTMSYPDGKVFTGLFHSNIRWGPGVESQACLKMDVGLWRGTQLLRLTWKPETPSIAPDLCTNPVHKALVDQHRVILSSRSKVMGKTNSALDLLKQCGSDPMSATENWEKLYPKNCTDLASLLCHTDAFERAYYKGKIKLLEEVNEWSEFEEDKSEDSDEVNPASNYYYAWNNNKAMVHMMKHSFMHDKQRNLRETNLTDILSGPRIHFKHAGKHELDCRTLLMASFLGHNQNIVQLVNEQGVHPDVADSQGNAAVMYATCGDQHKTIRFLVEAGANVDAYNDSCCTPLAVALLRYACAQNDISIKDTIPAMIPPPIVPAPPSAEQTIFEWCIERSNITYAPKATRSPSKLNKITSEKKLKEKPDISSVKSLGPRDSTSDESFTEDKRLYYIINNEFGIRLNELYLIPSKVPPIPYMFEVPDMVKEVDIPDEEPKKGGDKDGKKGAPKVPKDTIKPSKEVLWQPDKAENTSISSSEKLKEETLQRIMLTILELLLNGANPKLVRFPQPALFTAIVSECPDLVRHLVNSGADINEVYPMIFGYTPLDIAVSRPLSNQNLEVIKAVLECGAHTNHRLLLVETTSLVSTDITIPEIGGPTLLHAVLMKKPESEKQEEIQLSLLELLLNHNCDPMIQFKGQSAVDMALTKKLHLLHVFIENSHTNLNCQINNSNQTLLVKIFSMPFFKMMPSTERIQILTNLLLFGADPLMECKNGEETFPNLFVFAKRTLTELESNPTKPPPSGASRQSPPKKGKDDAKKAGQSMSKFGTDSVEDYKQALDLVVECARLLHVRWLQAKLMKELVDIIDKYKHRQWNMVMKEHKHKKGVRLWLTATRCLEIWDILRNTKKKIYNDSRILKYLLYIVTYYNTKTKVLPSTKLTAEEKHFIELNVNCVLKERKSAGVVTWKRPYVKPELTPKYAQCKFNVCFECALPFDEEKIVCRSCKLVSFCSLACMTANEERTNCHPCSDNLKQDSSQ